MQLFWVTHYASRIMHYHHSVRLQQPTRAPPETHSQQTVKQCSEHRVPLKKVWANIQFHSGVFRTGDLCQRRQWASSSFDCRLFFIIMTLGLYTKQLLISVLTPPSCRFLRFASECNWTLNAFGKIIGEIETLNPVLPRSAMPFPVGQARRVILGKTKQDT